jgi:hypothetical protein
MTRTQLTLKGIRARRAEPAARIKNIRAFAFDAYGTLFDVFSVAALCAQLFSEKGNALAQLWRAKQLRPIPMEWMKTNRD